MMAKLKTINTFFTLFFIQLLIIGMSINVRTDIPMWKQIFAYSLIASILPISKLLDDSSVKKKDQ